MANAKLIQANGAQTYVEPRAKVKNKTFSQVDIEDILNAPYFKVFQIGSSSLIIDGSGWRLKKALNQDATEIAHTEGLIGRQQVVCGNAMVVPNFLMPQFLMSKKS